MHRAEQSAEQDLPHHPPRASVDFERDSRRALEKALSHGEVGAARQLGWGGQRRREGHAPLCGKVREQGLEQGFG